MSSNIAQHGYINKLNITKNADGEITRVNALFNNGSKEYPSAVDTVFFNKSAQDIVNLFEESAANRRFFLEGSANAPGFEKDGQPKIGRTSFVVNKVAVSQPFVQGQENSQKEHGTTTGFVKTLNQAGDNGVSGVVSFSVGKGDKEKWHHVSFVAFGDRADFLKEIVAEGKGRVQFDHTFLNGNVKRSVVEGEKDKINPSQLRVDDITWTHKQENGQYVAVGKTLAQFRAEHKAPDSAAEEVSAAEIQSAANAAPDVDPADVDFDDWDAAPAM